MAIIPEHGREIVLHNLQMAVVIKDLMVMARDLEVLVGSSEVLPRVLVVLAE